MKNQLRRQLLAWVGASVVALNVAGSPADPTPIPRGEGNTLKGVTKALELMRNDPKELQLQRLGAKAKDIRFRMLVRKENDKELSPEYAWATRARPKGGAPQVVYPYDELVNRETGRAIIRFRINYEGRVDLSMVLEATKPSFGRAAQAAIETMTFTPAKKKDKSPALVLCDAEFEFKPDGMGDVLVTEETKDLLKLMQAREDAVIPNTELDGRLRPLNSINPVYPTAFSKVGTVGTATVEFIVNEAGWVVLPRVVSASEAEFGTAAVQAVSVWKFEPPMHKGRIVNTRARIEIEFNPPAQ